MRAFIALVVAGVAAGSRYVGDDVSLLQTARLSDGIQTPKCTEVINFGNPDPSNTYSNLGGKGPDSNTDTPQEIRLGSVGTDHNGVHFDLLIRNASAYVPADAENNNQILDGGSWVQINNAPGEAVTLNVSFVNKSTDTPLQLGVTKLTLCDIDYGRTTDGKKETREEYSITANAFYFTKDEPEFSYEFDGHIILTELPAAADSKRFIRKVTANDGVSPLRATMRATHQGHGCDNPKSPESLEVYRYVESDGCNAKWVGSDGVTGGTVDQAKRCFMFELDDSTGFQLDFVTDQILNGTTTNTAGRNLMLGAASAYFETGEPCPTPSPRRPDEKAA